EFQKAFMLLEKIKMNGPLYNKYSREIKFHENVYIISPEIIHNYFEKKRNKLFEVINNLNRPVKNKISHSLQIITILMKNNYYTEATIQLSKLISIYPIKKDIIINEFNYDNYVDIFNLIIKLDSNSYISRNVKTYIEDFIKKNSIEENSLTSNEKNELKNCIIKLRKILNRTNNKRSEKNYLSFFTKSHQDVLKFCILPFLPIEVLINFSLICKEYRKLYSEFIKYYSKEILKKKAIKIETLIYTLKLLNYSSSIFKKLISKNWEKPDKLFEAVYLLINKIADKKHTSLLIKLTKLGNSILDQNKSIKFNKKVFLENIAQKIIDLYSKKNTKYINALQLKDLASLLGRKNTYEIVKDIYPDNKSFQFAVKNIYPDILNFIDRKKSIFVNQDGFNIFLEYIAPIMLSTKSITYKYIWEILIKSEDSLSFNNNRTLFSLFFKFKKENILERGYISNKAYQEKYDKYVKKLTVHKPQ
ncbi:hypothetical protein ACFL2K_04560, partial [Candidatus Margulisiibacteriota bacterium]